MSSLPTYQYNLQCKNHIVDKSLEYSQIYIRELQAQLGGWYNVNVNARARAIP